jgi:hypothetical protein
MPHRLALTAILVVAAFLRLGHPDLSWFMLDQARDATVALEIVHRRSLPLVGPEVAGGPARLWGPLYFYLLAMPFAISSNPAVAAAFLSSLNVIAIYLVYRFGLSFFSPPVGLIAAALFAVHPTAVINGRGLWNLPPLPLFNMLFFWSLYRLVVNRQSIMVVPALAALACLTQLHLSTVAFFVVLALALLLYRPPLRPLHLALGLLAMLALYLPYLVAQMIGPTPDILKLVGETRTHATLPRRPLLLLVAQVFMAPVELGTRIAREVGPAGFAQCFRIVTTAEVALIGLGCIYVATRLAVPRERPAAGLLLLWLGTPLVVLDLLSRQFTWYYFDLLYPAPFLAAALLLAAVPRAWPPAAMAARTAVIVVVIAIMVTQGMFVERWWAFAARTGSLPIPPVHELGAPVAEAPILPHMSMRARRGVATALVDTLGGEPAALMTRAHGATIADFLEDKGYFFDWLSAGRPRRDGSSRHVAVLRETRGPLRVVEYSPRIDYQSWAYALAPTGPWTMVRLPTRGRPDRAVYGYPPLFRWGAGLVYLRGTIDVPTSPCMVRIVVALRDDYRAGADFGVDAFMVDDRPVAPESTVRYGSLVGRNHETIYALPPAVGAGRHNVVFRVSSPGGAFDLDVYEIDPCVAPTPIRSDER